MIDLHVHTTASDGTYTPSEVVDLAKKIGLTAVAITDHDTVNGLDEAKDQAQKIGIEFIDGIEISADFEIEMHILGYFINPKDRSLLNALNILESFREERNPKIVKKLQLMGYKITMEEVISAANGNIIGRPHIAKVLVDKGYFSNTKEVFDKLLSYGKPAYVKKDKLHPKDAIEIIKGSGGISILAHPHKFLYLDDSIENILIELMDYGLDGIEAIHSEHSIQEKNRLMEVAEKLSLIITGGSDFHGKNKEDIHLGTGKNNIAISDEILERLKERVTK